MSHPLESLADVIIDGVTQHITVRFTHGQYKDVNGQYKEYYTLDMTFVVDQWKCHKRYNTLGSLCVYPEFVNIYGLRSASERFYLCDPNFFDKLVSYLAEEINKILQAGYKTAWASDYYDE